MGWILLGFILAVVACGAVIVAGMALAIRDLDDAQDWDYDW